MNPKQKPYQISQPPISNEQIAKHLEEVADLFEAQGANPFRVLAYRTGAETIRGLTRPAHEILASEGLNGRADCGGSASHLRGRLRSLCGLDG